MVSPTLTVPGFTSLYQTPKKGLLVPRTCFVGLYVFRVSKGSRARSLVPVVSLTVISIHLQDTRHEECVYVASHSRRDTKAGRELGESGKYPRGTGGGAIPCMGTDFNSSVAPLSGSAQPESDQRFPWRRKSVKQNEESA